MKKTVYLLRNNSYSTGIYVIDGEERILAPISSVRVPTEPTSVTHNITKSVFFEDVPEPKRKASPTINKEKESEESVKEGE